MRRLLLLAAMLAAPAVAEAENPGWSAHVAPVLPTVAIAASTSGQGKIQAGLDILFGLPKISQRIDLSIHPLFETSTDNGVAKLFSLDNEKIGVTKPWFVGADFTFSRLVDIAFPDRSPEFVVQHSDEWETALRGCKSLGAGFPTSDPILRAAFDVLDALDAIKAVPDTTLFSAVPAAAVPLVNHALKTPAPAATETVGELRARLLALRIKKLRAVGTALFCPTERGKRLLKEAHDRDLAGQYPLWTVSFGAEAGTTSFQFLNGGNVLIPTAALTTATATKPQVSAAAVVNYVSPSTGFYVEDPAFVRYRWTGSNKTAKWCTAVGMAPRDGAPGMTDPAATCNEQALNGPKMSVTAQVGAILGYVDKATQFWRAGIGPFLGYASTGSSDQFIFAIQAPLYISFAKTTGDSAAYKGLIRLTPSFQFTYDSVKGRDTQIFANIEVLGQRQMFTRARDWF
jgi:hypothetical protein